MDTQTFDKLTNEINAGILSISDSKKKWIDSKTESESLTRYKVSPKDYLAACEKQHKTREAMETAQAERSAQKDRTNAKACYIEQFGEFACENKTVTCNAVCFYDMESETDREILNAFYSQIFFFVNGDEDPQILVEDAKTETVQVISMSSRTCLQSLTAACARAKRKTGESLAEFYRLFLEKANDAVLSACRGQTFTENNIGEALIDQGIPRIFLRESKVSMMVTQIVDERGKLLMLAPKRVIFTESPLEFLLSHATKLMCSSDMLQHTPPLPLSNKIGEKCLHRIIIDEGAQGSIVKRGECPTWDKFLLRYSADEQGVLMAFIWSIFDVSNNGRQMLYIYDSGYSGKSVMLNAIANYLGRELVMTLQKDSLNNQFSMAKIWDKRLIITPDNKNPNLVRSEKVHMILGGDFADIERKGRESFVSKIACKYIASGNTPLRIDTGANHEASRLIVIKPKLTDEMKKEFCQTDKNGNLVKDPNGKPKPKGDPKFSKALLDEFPQFLYKCKAAYIKNCPTGSDIIVPNSLLEELSELDDEKTIAIQDALVGRLAYCQKAQISYQSFKDLVDEFDIPESDNKAADVLTYLQKRYPDIRRMRNAETRREIVDHVRLSFDPVTDDAYKEFFSLAFKFSENGRVSAAQFWLAVTDICKRGCEGYDVVSFLGFGDMPKRINYTHAGRRFYDWVLNCKGVNVVLDTHSRREIITGIKLKTSNETFIC